MTTFQSIGLNPQMMNVVSHLYFKQPTEIQQKAIPPILKRKSIIGQSQTGSGKTHAYLLPLLQEIDESKDEVQLVLTAPTRELAMQINEEVKTIIELADKKDILQSRLLIGGLDRERMIKQLVRKPKIIVGTPGRILDMVNEGVLSIYHAAAFVMDEADLMVELNFLEAIDELLVRSKKDIQILVFSATIPIQLQSFFKKYLTHPEHIVIDNGIAPASMQHRLIAIKHQDIADKVVQISKIIQPYVAILFVNSKDAANTLSENLRVRGIETGLLHGGLTSRERTRMVKAINDLKYEYIVATDLASRGIDIKGTSHVINVELPKEIDFYLHRVGRTARAGLEGTAISFYADEDISLIQQLEKRGIHFEYNEIRHHEFVETKRFNQRVLRKNVSTELDKQAWRQVKKPKKVKPGYKKKMKKEQEQIKRKMKRQHYKKK